MRKMFVEAPRLTAIALPVSVDLFPSRPSGEALGGQSREALSPGDLSFIEGRFINQFSNQRFGGTSAQVPRFIGQLKGVGVWEVDVQFRDFGEQQSAFSLDQDSSKDHLRLIINSGRSDFLLKDFASYLPHPRLARQDLPKAGTDGAPGGHQPGGSEADRTPSVDVPRR